MDSSVSNVSHSDEDLVAMLQSVVAQVCPPEISEAYLKDLQEAFVAMVTSLSKAMQDNPGGEIAAELDRYAKSASGFFENSVSSELQSRDDNASQLEFAEKIRRLNALVEGHWLNLADLAEELEPGQRRLIKFHLRQIISALNPDNWPLTNPQIWQATISFKGENFTQGLTNLLRDLADSDAGFAIRACEDEALKLGVDIAPTKGDVVFQNELIQLIHYAAKIDVNSKKTDLAPILFVPPCINKFYILDLSEESSLVGWLVDQGADVYMISWVDPNSTARSGVSADEGDGGNAQIGATVSDYVEEGVGAALEFLQTKMPKTQTQLVGYCVGGLFAALAAASKPYQGNLSSLTLINTLLNYEDPGDVGVFTSPRMISALLVNAKKKGYVSGQLLSQMFSILKERQLFWPALVNRYFLGGALSKNPLVYWNHDVANLSLDMMEQYLSDFYRDNLLWKDGKYDLESGEACLADISVPVYLLACEKDHIVECNSALSIANKLSSNVSRVVASGGHVLGVLNPPNRRGGHYRVLGDDLELGTLEDILASMNPSKGSWWPHWLEWMADISKDLDFSPIRSERNVEPLEAAPGSYVRGSS